VERPVIARRNGSLLDQRVALAVSKRRPTPPGARFGKTVPIVLACLLLLGLAAWWYSQSSPKLSERHYDMTLALYRICNQQDADALQRFEAKVLKTSEDEGDVGTLPPSLQGILDDARSGNWERAMLECREVMDSQIQR